MWDGKTKQMRDVVMPGVGLYRTDASRTGEHVGTDKPVYGPMVEYELSGVKICVPEWCAVTVYRLKNGIKCAYTAEEYWIENYATAGKDTTAPNSMWKKRARGQLAKCAEAQALRKAFPEVGSQPTADEMEGKSIDMGMAEVVTPPPPPPSPPELEPWPDDKLNLREQKIREWGAAGKTVDEIVAFLGSKGTISQEQKARISKWMAEAAAPAMTYAQVADALTKAADSDALAAAADLINTIADQGQRDELSAIFDRRQGELA
jgi:predicted transcriptional regulator